MTSTLLIRLQTPMQAWGVESKFNVRDTCREPTKSGIIGLLCCALGRKRDENVDDLVNLRMGVRVDQEGVMMRDFQTARNIMSANGEVGADTISQRFYLSDAIFLVGLEGSDDLLLKKLLNALQHPRWLLYLGRRAFPPSNPVWLRDGLKMGINLESALEEYPFLGSEKTFQKSKELRYIIEDPNGSITQRDYPLLFATRTFQSRSQKVYFRDKPAKRIEEVLDVS